MNAFEGLIIHCLHRLSKRSKFKTMKTMFSLILPDQIIECQQYSPPICQHLAHSFICSLKWRAMVWWQGRKAHSKAVTCSCWCVWVCVWQQRVIMTWQRAGG